MGMTDGAAARPRRPDPDVVSLQLRVVVGVMAAAAVVALVMAREWLAMRTFWAAVFVAVAVARWPWRAGERPDDEVRRRLVVGTVLLVVAAVVVGTGLGHETAESRQGDMYPALRERILGDDLAPRAAYVAAACLAAAAAAGVALVWAGRREQVGPGRRRKVVGIGIGAGLALVAAIVGVADVLHGVVDRRADRDNLVHEVHRVAEPVAGPTGGPDRPAPEPSWTAAPLPVPGDPDWRGEGSRSRPPGRHVAPVPGWDVVLVVQWASPFGIAAVSASDGAELWSYSRIGAVHDVTVDPDAGRVLITRDAAAVVLDLEDGSEVATRRLPHGRPTDDDQGSRTCWTLDGAEVTTFGPVRLSECEDGDLLVAVEVATAEVVGVAEVPDRVRRGAREGCDHAAAPTADGSAVLRVGTGACERPVLLDPTGSAGVPADGLSIDPPPGRVVGPRTEVKQLVPADDMLVAALTWHPGGAGEPVEEVVALNPDDGAVWRQPASSPGLPTLAVGTRHGVLAWSRGQGAGEWQVLSPVDGTVAATGDMAAHESGPGPEVRVEPRAFTVDDDRLYSIGHDDDADAADLLVRDLADLSLVGVWEGIAPADTVDVVVTADQVIFATPDRLVAHGDATEPPTRTDLPPPYAEPHDGGDVRVVDPAFSIERSGTDHEVTVGLAVENDSEMVARRVTVRSRALDADGEPVAGGRWEGRYDVGTVEPGERVAVDIRYTTHQPGVADVEIDLTADEWWPADLDGNGP